MKTALVQIASPTREPAPERRKRVRRLLDTLPPDVDLIVLPELWAVGFNHFDEYAAEAETVEGPTVTMCAEVARARSTWVQAGSIVQRTAEGSMRNTTVLLDPTGEVAMTTSKIHIFGYASREVDLLQPGDRISTVATPYGRMGSTTCYDLRFPSLWNELVEAGAELVLVPAAWPAARLPHWQLLTAARALDTQTYVIACNSCRSQDGVQLGGHSRVIDPWGEVIAEAGDDEELLLVDIDPTKVAATRAEFPMLADRLVDYRALRTAEVTA